jgi:hypothetical protein
MVGGQCHTWCMLLKVPEHVYSCYCSSCSLVLFDCLVLLFFRACLVFFILSE